jgi:hypothetical protein
MISQLPQHCRTCLSLGRHSRVDLGLPHSTWPCGDSLRSLLQLDVSSDELSSPPLPTGSFCCRLMSLAANSPCCRSRRCPLWWLSPLSDVSCRKQPLLHHRRSPDWWLSPPADVSCGKQPLLPPPQMFWLLLGQVHRFQLSSQTRKNGVT